MYLQIDELGYSDEGTFVLISDACHPILSYIAQGANS